MKKSLCFLLICSVVWLNGCKTKDDPTPATLEYIEVTKQPSTTRYAIGEKFDITGMEVTAIYSDGTTKPITITDNNIDFDFSVTGYQTVTITYEGKIAEVTITVVRFNGSGASDSPYLIGNPLQLAMLAELVNDPAITALWTTKFYKLTADINLSVYGANFNESKGWIPIGNESNQFKGSFDGAGHTVSNLYINSSEDGTGLFGYVVSGTITNLGVTNAKVTGGYETGGVAGSLVDGNIIDCYATAEVSGNNYVGGVVGYIKNSNISNCYATGAVSGNDHVGGVAGYANNSNVSNCYATGAVSGAEYVGGIAGYIDFSSELSNCYATGAVSGNDEVGGVAGYVWDSNVNDCAALNPSITRKEGSYIYFGRVAGYTNMTLSNNVAWYSMWVVDAAVLPSNENGENINYTQIINDGTIGNRFTSSGGWKTENGKLPGFDTTLSIPGHLIE